MTKVRELTPAEYVQRWPLDRNHPDVVLLDVREPDELEIASLNFTLNVPMGRIPMRIASFEKNKTYVVMCHSGGRSLRVAEYLSSNGFEDVYNMAGGITQWSREIDDEVPRY